MVQKNSAKRALKIHEAIAGSNREIQTVSAESVSVYASTRRHGEMMSRKEYQKI